MARKPYLIVIPMAAQGHVAPMMKLAYDLVHNGIKVTFVNTVSMHLKLMSAAAEKFEEADGMIRFVSIPELNSDSGKDRIEKAENATCFLQCQLQNLIRNINQFGEHGRVTHLIADVSVSWAFKVANQVGVKAVGFVPYGLENFAFFLHTSKLIESGIVDVNGAVKEDQSICLSKDIQAWNHQNVLWRYPDNEEQQRFIFRHFFHNIPEEVKSCNTILANTFHQLETAACNLLPNTLPIGPLFSRHGSGISAGNMLAEDASCLSWLDRQPIGSVIYAAFGSTFRSSQEQLAELVAAFEITGKPFLWVVRPDLTKEKAAELPEGFKERVARYGKIAEWAPQEKVLAHPSVACFFSHCGWNSTIEGVSKGVPFLCWPYAWDQFHNRDNICKTWRVGLEVVRDDEGIVTRDEIKCKIEKVICDEEIKANAINMKEIAAESIREGGSSYKNFKNFIDHIK